jgi:hypothetical protein
MTRTERYFRYALGLLLILNIQVALAIALLR